MALAGGAAVAAAAAYLDAKYHLSKDIGMLRELRRTTALAQKLDQQKRCSLWYFFEEQALRLKDEPCLWYRTQPSEPTIGYTWTQTYQTSCQWGQFLLDNGVQPGELVGTYLQNSPEFMFNFLGTWAVGCAPALINYHLGGESLLHCLKVAGSKILLVDEEPECQQRIEEVADKLQYLGIRVFIVNAEFRAKIASYPPSRPSDDLRRGVTGADPMCLLYTSGTTGLPKGCIFAVGRSYSLGTSRIRTVGLKSGPNGNVWYDCMPLYHGTGATVALGCMMGGLTLAIGRKFSVRNFWLDIHDSGAHAFVYVGETARYLLAAPPSPLDKGHKLKAMYGNGMRPDVWQKFQTRFAIPRVNEFFNSSEGMLSLLNVCTGPFNVAHVGQHGLILRKMHQNLYIPVEIDYEHGDNIWRDPRTGFARRRSYEEGGEILVAVQTKEEFAGYYNNPQATDKRFERDVFAKGDLYYRSGDALRRDADGRWYFLDRLGDTFRWKSENVSTAEVAEVLGGFPAIVEANVYGVEVPGHDGRAGCAAVYIRPEERAGFDYAGLLGHARRALPRYAVPVFLRVITSPTPMHNNKQNKVPLRLEGVDLEKVAGGNAGREDRVLWAKPGAETYCAFTQRDWNSIVGGKVRL